MTKDLRLVPYAIVAILISLCAPIIGPHGMWLMALAAALLSLSCGALVMRLRNTRIAAHSAYSSTATLQMKVTGSSKSKSTPADRRSFHDRKIWAQISCALGICALLIVRVAVHAGDPDTVEFLTAAQRGDFARLQGVVASDPTPQRTGAVDGHPRASYLIRIDTAHIKGTSSTPQGDVRVLVQGDYRDQPAYGSRIEVSGELIGIGTGQTTLALLKSGSLRQLAQPSGIRAVTNYLRESLVAHTAGMSEQAQALVPGTAIGDTRLMSQEMAEEMRASGLTHITAVSGSHFAIILSVILMLSGRLHKHLQVSVAAFLSLGFVMLVHPSGAVLRAFIMGCIALSALLLKRQSQGLAALSTAVIAMLMWNPNTVRDFGFILSVAATAGLICATSPVARFMHSPRGEGNTLVPMVAARVVAVPLVAYSFCAPVLVLMNPELNLWTVPANLVAAPAVFPATIFSLLATLTSPIDSRVATACAVIASGPTWWIAWSAKFFSALPLSRISWIEGPGGSFAALALLALLALSALAYRRQYFRLPHTRKRLKTTRSDKTHFFIAIQSLRRCAILWGSAVAGVIVVAVLFAVRPPWLEHVVSGAAARQWSVVACDVGQGDAFLVRGVHGTYMVDTGQDAGDLLRCVTKFDVQRLDVLFISHFHADHMGAFDEVTKKLAIDRIVISGASPDDSTKQKVLAAAQRQHISIMQCTVEKCLALPGDEATSGLKESEWDIVWPTDAEADYLSNLSAAEDITNDSSLVVRFTLTDRLSAIFLGDLTDEGQDRLARHMRQSESTAQRADLVKMAHHGSASQSRALAEILSPQVTLIGVGAGNSYGHPTKHALDLYQRLGSVTMSTMDCGSFGVYKSSERWFVTERCP